MNKANITGKFIWSIIPIFGWFITMIKNIYDVTAMICKFNGFGTNYHFVTRDQVALLYPSKLCLKD